MSRAGRRQVLRPLIVRPARRKPSKKTVTTVGKASGIATAQAVSTTIRSAVGMCLIGGTKQGIGNRWPTT